jgi:hypothetical protein
MESHGTCDLRIGERSWQHAGMPWTPRDEFGKRLNEQFNAELLLCKMDQCEELAESYDEMSRGDVCETNEWEVKFFRQRHAKLYRETIGVAPERRRELRAALDRIQATGQQSVQAVLAVLNSPEESVISRDESPFD